MNSLKRVFVVTVLIGAIASVSACRREVRHEPMKLGGDVVHEQTVR